MTVRISLASCFRYTFGLVRCRSDEELSQMVPLMVGSREMEHEIANVTRIAAGAYLRWPTAQSKVSNATAVIA